MELQEVLRRRRMTRNFTREPVAAEEVDAIVANARRAPSAGNTRATEFLVLHGPEATQRFWDATLPSSERGDFPWPGLLEAPVLIVFLANETAYRERYAEPDKGVIDQTEFWPVPYWHVDAGFAAMLAQLTALDRGLGCLFFGIFPPRLAAFREAFGVPDIYMPTGAVAVGHPAPTQRRSRSLDRPGASLEEVVHRGSW